MGIAPLGPSYNVGFILFDLQVLYAWVLFSSVGFILHASIAWMGSFF